MRSPFALLAIAVTAVVVLVLVESRVALAIVLMDGALAAGILALAAIPGMLLLRLVGARVESAVCRFIFGAGLGAGLLCLLEFTLGVCGLLTRGWWIGTFGGIVLLSLALYAPTIRGLLTTGAVFNLARIERRHWLWLAVVPFAALTLIVATAPPGVLWPAEGNGYDVLEYHLAVPKAYWQAGHIEFLPNNAYSNFPFNAEMLYLLAMVLKGGPIEGILLAKMFNAAMAFLFVAAMWTAARPIGSRPALIAGVLAGTCGWLVYLSGVAYVENTMLAFTALAFGAWTRWTTGQADAAGPAGFTPEYTGKHQGIRLSAPPECWALLAGLFAGLACGCKYTAIVFVAIPLGAAFMLAWVSLMRRLRTGGPAGRLAFPRTILLYALGILVTFAPWLLKNAVFCGNSVFPQATAALGYRPGIWDGECEARWAHGHLPPTELRSLAGRLRATWQAVIAEPLTGPAIWVLGAAAVILNATGVMRRADPDSDRSRAMPLSPLRGSGDTASRDPGLTPRAKDLRPSGAYETRSPRVESRTLFCGPLATIIVAQLILWAAFTHLANRFAVPILPPLMLLAAVGLASGRHGQAGSTEVGSGPLRRDMVMFALILLGAAVNLYHAGGLYYDRTRFQMPEGRVETLAWQGQVEWFTEGQWPGTEHLGFINRDLPANANVLLVADARSLYVLRRCDYCVVFNPNPFARAVRAAGDTVGVLGWLRRSGYTHVYVDWTEMRRLRATYGFWSEIDEALFVRLEKVGLRRIRDFSVSEDQRPYGTIYEVRP